MDNLFMSLIKNLPLTAVVLVVIFLLPALIIYLWRNFEISEITPSPTCLKLSRKTIVTFMVCHNLPQPDYGRFIGREKELALINRILRPYPYSQHSIITIDGVGGVGKSALALEIAHRYLRDNKRLTLRDRFGAIVWVSAKRSILTASGIVSRKQAFRTLPDIYSSIAITIGGIDVSKMDEDEQSEMVRKILTQQRTLLVVDNLETVDDETVLNFLRELPAPSKAIVTTRHRIDVAYSIRLTGMEWKDAQILIAEECEKKSVVLNDEDAHHLYDRTGGIPLAIVWSIAQLGRGYTSESMLNRLGQHTGDVARFCFEEVIGNLQNKPAYYLLCALALFENGVARDKLGYIANQPLLDRDDGLVELEKLSLINRDEGIFKMLPLTREYVRGELEKYPSLRSRLEQRLSIKTILILAANPKDTPRLRLDEEMREIYSGLQRAQQRDDFVIRQALVERPGDIRRALLDFKPNIVHFSGHGDTNGIALEGETGSSKLLDAEALASFFEIFTDQVECVILSACYSESQALAISRHISYVVGTAKDIGDSAAIEFAVAFYDALGAGMSFEFAYNLACNAIQFQGMPEHLTPVLIKKRVFQS